MTNKEETETTMYDQVSEHLYETSCIQEALQMISLNIMNMEDKDSSVAPLKNNDDIISELLGHHFATIINSITFTLTYKK